MKKEIRYYDMYNADLKKEFLDKTYTNEDSKLIIANVFYNSNEFEVKFSKDLCFFTLDEVERFIKSLKLTTYPSVRSVGSSITSYINFAFSKTEVIYELNFMNRMDDSEEWYKSLISTKNVIYWTKSFIEYVVSCTNDYQDKAMIMLIFEGVYGRKLSEIRNLKISDINIETNIAKVYNDNNEEREVKLSSETIRLIQQANSNSHYTNANGQTFELGESDYVFKNTTRGKHSHNNQPSQIQLLNRISKVAESIKLPKFVPNNINKSGMLYTYHQELLKKNDNKIDYHNINNNIDLNKKEIEDLLAEKYDWSLLKSSLNYSFYNTSVYRKAFLNLETVLGLYKQ